MSFITPAVLPSSRADLEKKLVLIKRLPTVSRVQVDVVDGRLAAPASWPYTAPEELQAMVRAGEMLPYLDRFEYEVDLMCFDALRSAGDWLAQGATRLTFHTESSPDLPGFLSSARDRLGHFITFGLALNITSDLALVRPCRGELGYVQFMGIAKIGRQGEPLDERVFEKIAQFTVRYPGLPFQVDGGVTLQNAKRLVALGATNLVVGSAILRAKEPSAVVAEFEALRTSFGV